MNIRYRPINEISEADLEELIAYGLSESKHIDYKRDLPEKNRRGTVDFLSDVSSSANATGGHIIYGVSESKGIPIPIISPKNRYMQ